MFTQEELDGILQRLECSKETDFDREDFMYTHIGSGTSAKVYSVDFGAKKYVVKRFMNNNEGIVDIKQELDIFNTISAYNHPNIISLYGYSLAARSFVMEYAEQSDLRSYMKSFAYSEKRKKQFLELRLEMILGMIQGIAFLHKHRIIHRDIKLPNMLLTKNAEVKICDFAFSQILPPDQDKIVDKYLGTMLYVSPEICDKNHAEYSFGSDLWALGVSIWILYSLGYPYQHCRSLEGKGEYDLTKCLAHIKNGGIPDTSLISDEGVRELVVTFWNHNPQDRRSAEYAAKKIGNTMSGMSQ